MYRTKERDKVTPLELAEAAGSTTVDGVSCTCECTNSSKSTIAHNGCRQFQVNCYASPDHSDSFRSSWANVRQTFMGSYFWALETEFVRPNMRVFLGGTVKNTDRLLRMLPGALGELIVTVFHFSRLLLWFLTQPFSFLWSLQNMIVCQH